MSALLAYEAGLAGNDCWFEVVPGRRRALPVPRWRADAGEDDAGLVRAVLAGLRPGAGVLDVGCGPGRLTAALAGYRPNRQIDVLGLDISARAVELSRARGVSAVLGDVLSPPPAHWLGAWHRVLLADGNLGIGGDPVTLLHAVRPLLARGGRVIADLRAGGGIVRAPVWVEAVDDTGRRVGGSMPWAWVGADAAHELAAEVGLRVRGMRPHPRGALVIWQVS